jgi:hypothetical protein
VANIYSNTHCTLDVGHAKLIIILDTLNFSIDNCMMMNLFVFLFSLFFFTSTAFCDESEWHDWSVGGYAGQYYDTEPAGFSQGKANYLNQYIVALTASKTIWRSESLPYSLELDGMVGQQFGLATLTEVAIAPVIRWSSFPWKDVLQTDLRVGPLGLSYTSMVSPLERGTSGDGSHVLNFLLIELDFSLPEDKSKEVFLRLHHRCTIYDLLNNYGANGEDFFAIGYRQHL